MPAAHPTGGKEYTCISQGGKRPARRGLNARESPRGGMTSHTGSMPQSVAPCQPPRSYLNNYTTKAITYLQTHPTHLSIQPSPLLFTYPYHTLNDCHSPTYGLVFGIP